MTWADDRKAEVIEVAKIAQRAVVRGQNAVDFTNTAVAANQKVIDDLEQVLAQAIAEMELFDQNLIPGLNQIFEGSFSAEISNAIEYTKAGRKNLESFINHIVTQLTLVKQTSRMLTHWKENDLQASGGRLLEAMRELAEYNSKL